VDAGSETLIRRSAFASEPSVVPGIRHPFPNVTAIRVSVTDLGRYGAESPRKLLALAEERGVQIAGHEYNLVRS
jgi:hypothetical protein